MSALQRRVLLLIVLAEAGVLSVWFAAAAGLPSMAMQSGQDVTSMGSLTVAVQIGFIVGGLLLALGGWVHRIDKRHLFLAAAQLAALSSVLLVFVPIGGGLAHLLRFTTGFALAGVYPIGLAILADWADRHRAFFAGSLVGALTVGTAVPHLASLVGTPDWRMIMLSTAALASLSSLLVLGVPRAPVAPRADGAALPASPALDAPLRHPAIRLAIAGYLGHMWELYAFWGWIAVALTWSFSQVYASEVASRAATIVTIIAVVAGALASVWAGFAADRIGKALVAKRFVQVSAVAGLFCAASLALSPEWTAVMAILWGTSIIGDSGQYSALIAEETPAALRTRMLTLVTALGYAVSAFSLQLSGWIASSAGWPLGLMVLSVGPIVSILAMDRLIAPAALDGSRSRSARMAAIAWRTCCR